MNPQYRSDLVVNKEYLYRNYKSYDDLGYNRQQRKQLVKKSSSPDQKLKAKVLQYESPFIQKSREKALERAKLKKALHERPKKPWNDDFASKSIDFFDGGKKEDKLQIFKRERRIPPEKVQTKDNNSIKMTRRRDKEDIPLMPSRMIPRNAQSQNPQVNAEDFPQSPFQRKEILEPDRPPTQSADIASPAPSNPGYSSMPLPIASHHSSPLISATVRSQFSPPNTHSPAITEKENFPVQRTQYPECGYPSASPEKFITFEPEIVRVKTRGTSPFSSTDFEKIFPESFDSSNSQPNPVNSASKPQQSPKDLSPGYGSFPQSGSSLNGIETATLKILESQTKAQEVHGDMIGKFTNLVAELGKIITHREMSSSVPNSGKKIKKKKMSSESPSQDSPPIRHMAPITSTNTIATVGKTALERKSPRSRRDDVLDLILQRLQALETQEFFISESLSSTIQDSPIPVAPEQKEVKGELSKPPTSTGNEFIPPQISNTFEVSADILTLAEVGSGWLMADGREEKRTRQAAVSSQPIDSQINGLITIRAQAPLKQDLAVYRKDFQRSMHLKEAVFRHHHTSLAEVTDSLTEHIMDTILEEATEEFEKIIWLIRMVKGSLEENSTVCDNHKFMKYIVPISDDSSSALSVKFRSLVPKDISMWYDDRQEGVYQGILKFGQETTVTSYPGHQFYFQYAKGSKDIINRIEVTDHQVLYVISTSDSASTSGMKTMVEEYQRRSQGEMEFMNQYYQKTGRHWLHYYDSVNGKPRNPPRLNMWPAEYLGFVRQISTSELYWTCSDNENCRTNTINVSRSENSTFFTKLSSLLPRVSTPTLTLEMQTISLSPRAFLVENFLSDFEANEMIRLASPNVEASVVGQTDSGGIFKSNTRTSSNTWIKRSTSPIIETLYRRVANILGIQHELLTTNDHAEDIQVVHYHIGEEYQAHYDWGVRGYPESRFITVLLYLSENSDPQSGGETSFPKARFKIRPKKGNAVVFYSLLEDGNGDINSLHASVPVVKGEKWLANFWVWDPYLPPSIRTKK